MKTTRVTSEKTIKSRRRIGKVSKAAAKRAETIAASVREHGIPGHYTVEQLQAMGAL